MTPERAAKARTVAAGLREIAADIREIAPAKAAEGIAIADEFDAELAKRGYPTSTDEAVR